MARRTRSFRVAATLSAAVLSIGLGGCAAGQISQTADQVAAIDGGNATVGSIGLRNVLFATPDAANYGVGSTVPITLVVSNSATTSDTLTAVSSPIGTAKIGGSGKIVIGPQSLTTIALDGDSTIALQRVTSPVCFGRSVPLTFTFATAGQVTLRVPVANPTERTGPRPTINIQPPVEVPLWETGHAEAGHAEGSGTAEESSHAEGSASAPATSAGSGTVTGVSAGPAAACNMQSAGAPSSKG